jgi:hypothetical protein
MNATNPIQIDGKTYPKFSLSLIVCGSYTPDGHPEASVVCNLTPTRIADGKVETAPEGMANIRLGSLAEADEATLIAVTAIQSAMQQFISAKGL